MKVARVGAGLLCADAHCFKRFLPPSLPVVEFSHYLRDFAACRAPALAFLINPLLKLTAVEVRVEQPVAVKTPASAAPGAAQAATRRQVACPRRGKARPQGPAGRERGPKGGAG